MKNVELGETIIIDTFKSKNCFLDKELTKRIKDTIIFQNDEIEIQIVTPHEVVGYCKNKNIYIVIDKLEFKFFEYD